MYSKCFASALAITPLLPKVFWGVGGRGGTHLERHLRFVVWWQIPGK